MTYRKITRRARLGTAMAALAVCLGSASMAEAKPTQPRTYRPSSQTLLSIGEGQVVNLSRNVSDVWVSAPDIADVYVTSPRQLNLFGKKTGEATVIATAADGSVVYATNARVSQNLSSVNEVIRAAMPDSNITVTSVGQVAVINGIVASPQDAAQAQAIVTSYLNPGKKEGDALDIMPINRLKTATPLQVMLKVRIVEMNRSLVKQFGINLLSKDHGKTLFHIGRGDPGSITTQPGVYDPVTGTISGNIDPGSGALPGQGIVTFNQLAGGTTLGLFGKILGLDMLGTLDLLENDGIVTSLAEPNLTALSGETASFLAGGEFPIPVSEGDNGQISVSYKKYGVSLDFTPTVLQEGLISLDIAPEVSSLDPSSSYRAGDLTIPGFIVRRAHTSVDLKSGQSFMIAGLLQSQNDTTRQQIPGLGRVPVLGALFSSKAYQRRETDLVMIVTPYLVKPMDPTKRPRTPADGSYPASTADYFLGNVDETKARGTGALAFASPTQPAVPAPTSGHFLDLPVE
jgi:pilus assembly protein CpaC